MKKLIPIILIFALLLTGCSGVDLFDDLLGDHSKNTTKSGGLKPDIQFSAEGAMSKSDDKESYLNTLPMDEDMKFTEDAEEYNIIEYNVLFDFFEINPEDVIPANNVNVSGFEILEEYNTGLPVNLEMNLIYDRYDVAFDYVLAMSDNVNVRSKPTLNSSIVTKAYSFEKLNVLAKVKGQYLDSFGDNVWYEIMWKEGDTAHKGYIFGKLAEKRTFRLKEMLEAADGFRNALEDNYTAYIANYKNRNGRAPQFKGADTDEYGISREQAAPAYKAASEDSELRYLPDGTVVILLDKSDDFYKIEIPGTGEEYYVPIQYVSGLNAVEKLSQVVVIDTKNQNEAVFQYFKNGWQLVSVTYASTCSQDMLIDQGKAACYKVIEKKEKLEYFDSSDEKVEGFAPWALRFSGSSYIYGVPSEYENKGGEISDAEVVEYIFTLGTLPRTRIGIRNYTSHAKYLYDWLLENESAVVILP